jgi:hypothetical protein
MKTSRFVATSALALVVLTGTLLAAEPLKSGPEVGEKLKTPFEPLNINGEFASQKKCQFCLNGTNPVVMVFARDVNGPVTKLIREVDAATAKNSDAKMGSFFVFLSDEEAMEKKLKELAKKEDLKKTVLTIDGNGAPEVEAYKIAKDAEVTVVLYTDRTVKANYSFKKGQLKDKDVEKVIADLPKILK